MLEVVWPVAVPEPLAENEPVAPANFPVPPVIAIAPVADEDPPMNGIRIPAGIEKVPTKTSPLWKTRVKVPKIGAVLEPDNVAALRFPAAEKTALPKLPTEPLPTTAKLAEPTKDAFPDNDIVEVPCPRHIHPATAKRPATRDNAPFIFLNVPPLLTGISAGGFRAQVIYNESSVDCTRQRSIR